MPTSNIEDYLKQIYKLQSSEKRVTTSLLANRLSISPASVTDMVKKLSEQGLLRHTPYRGVELTAEGKKHALRIVRRHRLWEVLLVELLHFSWDKIDDEAERLEHSTSEELERKIDEVLGYPKTDPHGDPIPTEDGELRETAYVSLAGIELGEACKITRVSDSNPETLQYATSLGLSLKKTVVVIERIKFDGSLRVKVGRKEIYVSQKLAQNVFVERTK
jgi:DtxR family Mn-dependent transcriptional regulator